MFLFTRKKEKENQKEKETKEDEDFVLIDEFGKEVLDNEDNELIESQEELILGNTMEQYFFTNPFRTAFRNCFETTLPNKNQNQKQKGVIYQLTDKEKQILQSFFNVLYNKDNDILNSTLSSGSETELESDLDVYNNKLLKECKNKKTKPKKENRGKHSKEPRVSRQVLDKKKKIKKKTKERNKLRSINH